MPFLSPNHQSSELHFVTTDDIVNQLKIQFTWTAGHNLQNNLRKH